MDTDFLKELFGSGEGQDLQVNNFLGGTGSGTLQSHETNDHVKMPHCGLGGDDKK